VPWPTDYDTEQDRIRAQSGEVSDFWEIIDGPIERLQTYNRAVITEALLWGIATGGLYASLMLYLESRSQRGKASVAMS